MKKSHCICIFLNVLSKIGPFFCLFSWEVFTVISRKILFFWEKCHFEKNPIFIRKRQDFLMIITACSQCQPVEKFWLEAALGKMWRNFVFLQNSLFSWEILFFSKILCFCFCYTLYVYFSYTLYVYFCYTLYVCFCYTEKTCCSNT